MGKRVIVTGGTGFVGANLTRRLLAEGHELTLLVRPEYRSWRIEDIRPHVRLHETNLGNKEELAKAVQRVRPEWVFHLAAHGAYPSQSNLHLMIETNILGTINLVEACLDTGFEVLINTGSSSEYGFQDHPPKETEELEPNSHYAVTKASASMFCRFTAKSADARILTLRLYSVFGPYEEPSRLLPTLILLGKRGRLPPLVNPEVARDFVHVDDVVEAYCLAANSTTDEPGAVYNVGTGVQTSLRDVVDVARRVMAIEEEPQWGTMPDRRWDTNTWVSDHSKINSELGWRPRLTFEDGFLELVRWFDEHPELIDFYERQNLPPA
jgi:dolichol-phosphate mannosyltransferase